jgi:hypothetical protein
MSPAPLSGTPMNVAAFAKLVWDTVAGEAAYIVLTLSRILQVDCNGHGSVSAETQTTIDKADTQGEAENVVQKKEFLRQNKLLPDSTLTTTRKSSDAASTSGT